MVASQTQLLMHWCCRGFATLDQVTFFNVTGSATPLASAVETRSLPIRAPAIKQEIVGKGQM